MSRSLNLCQFIGRLGRDPETKDLSGGKVTNFSIAVDWKTAEKEGTEWVNLTAFGKLGEICQKFLKKGSRVYVQGRFRTRTWDKDGEKRYATEIVLDEMQMLDGKPADGAAPSPTADRAYDTAAQTTAPAESFDDDALPF